MTVESLQVAKNCIIEAPDLFEVVYEYIHSITGKKLYSLETPTIRGRTEASQYVLNPRIIWTKGNG